MRQFSVLGSFKVLTDLVNQLYPAGSLSKDLLFVHVLQVPGEAWTLPVHQLLP